VIIKTRRLHPAGVSANANCQWKCHIDIIIVTNKQKAETGFVIDEVSIKVQMKEPPTIMIFQETSKK
jgi:hypothetical protein